MNVTIVYNPPKVEVVESVVEQGFATSTKLSSGGFSSSYGSYGEEETWE